MRDLSEAVRDLERWTHSFEAGRSSLDEDAQSEVRALLRETRGFARADGESQRTVALAILDVYATGLRLGDAVDIGRIADGDRLCELALFELHMSLDRPLVRWLTKEVLVRPESHSDDRRAACAFALAGERDERLVLALITCAREEGSAVREAALWALAGRDEASVHRLFLGLLEVEDFAEASPALGPLEEHFSSIRLDADSPATPGLTRYVQERIFDEDWRLATHAIEVSGGLQTTIVAPLWIDALALWMRRAEDGQPVRRVQNDLVAALEERSGMRLGPHPGRWRTWFTGVQAGQVPLQSEADESRRTEATFFGIRPLTDRVVFLIDHSGSMDGWMGPRDGRTASRDWTRYREAVEQMLFLLEDMGPRTRFNVILFDERAEAWNTDLRNATPSRLKTVRRWLLSRPPKGGTFLRQGFERAVGLKPGGSLDRASTEADTLIVLCDGQTAEGSSWVRPLIRRLRPRDRWVVHAVQLGRFGDDTLEKLAELTGGEHVRL